MRTAWIGIVLALGASACRVELGAREGDSGAAGRETTVHVYSSIYKEVIDQMQPVIDKQLETTAPGTKVEWFQSGSEKIAAKLDAELAAGGSPADILLMSDPSYYAKLQKAGLLVPYVSPAVLRQPREFVDRDGHWATARISTMVIGVTASRAAKGDVPRAFADLAKPAAGRVTMPDPLSSGTTFVTVSQLSARLGWDFFRALKKKGTIAAGGNSSVLQRLDTGEAEVGILLMENVIAGKARGSHIEMVIPSDGVVLIPGQIALLPHAKRSHAAQAVYDAILTDEVQRVIVEKGVMHSPDPLLPPPAGMPSLDELIAGQPVVKAVEPPEAVKTTFDTIFFR